MNNLIRVAKNGKSWEARVERRTDDGKVLSAIAVGEGPEQAIMNIGFAIMRSPEQMFDENYDPDYPLGRPE